MDDFIKLDVLENVLKEFPDLATHDENAIKFNNANEVKFAGRGMGILSPSALYLTSYLNSDLFLNYLNVIFVCIETILFKS